MTIVKSSGHRRRALPYLRPDDEVVLLLADDFNARLVMLEGLGSRHRVTVATTAVEARQLLAEFTYRLVIVTNFGMPPRHAISVIPPNIIIQYSSSQDISMTSYGENVDGGASASCWHRSRSHNSETR